MSINGVSSNYAYAQSYKYKNYASSNKQANPLAENNDSVKESTLQPELRLEELEGQEIKLEANPFNREKNEDLFGQEEECQTCKNRKYQDGSDDPGVSYKSPTHISPGASASAVMGHESEHVNHEKANAMNDDREIVRQSVMLKMGVCPECGKTYVAGGETTTVTKAKVDKAYNAGKDDASNNFNLSV